MALSCTSIDRLSIVPMRLIPVTSTDGRAKLEQHQANGLHVDARLLAEIEKPGEMLIGSLESREDLLNLVWQSIDDTRPLAPVGSTRTLGDCATRLSHFGWQFHTLVTSGFGWFKRCIDIDAAFDYSKVGFLVLTPLVNSEKRETPQGTYYIYDGAHKSIVLAKKLLRNEITFQAVEVLLLTPRRS